MPRSERRFPAFCEEAWAFWRCFGMSRRSRAPRCDGLVAWGALHGRSSRGPAARGSTRWARAKRARGSRQRGLHRGAEPPAVTRSVPRVRRANGLACSVVLVEKRLRDRRAARARREVRPVLAPEHLRGRRRRLRALKLARIEVSTARDAVNVLVVRRAARGGLLLFLFALRQSLFALFRHVGRGVCASALRAQGSRELLYPRCKEPRRPRRDALPCSASLRRRRTSPRDGVALSTRPSR